MITAEERREILELAAQAFTKANKRSRNDIGTGHPELGAIINRHATALGWTQSELADSIGKHKTFVNKVINGDRGVSVETLSLLDRELGVSFTSEFLKKFREIKEQE